MNLSQKQKWGIGVVVFGLVMFGLGTYAGVHKVPEVNKITNLENKDDELTTKIDFAPFWKTWNLLQEKYVPKNVASATPEERNLYTQKLVWGAIEGLTASVGDPYTVFLPPQENDFFKSDIAGNFEGVGMEIGIRDDVLTVIAPLKNSPSEKAGMKVGDRILEINGTSTQGIKVDEAVGKIRGKGGTSVKLLVLHKDATEPITISITRGKIELPTLDTEVKQNSKGERVFVIKLYSFSATSPNLFRNALQTFVGEGTDKLILDLRGNPGGYLEAAVDMASWFLPEGKTIVREYYGPDKAEEVHRSRGYDIFTSKLKLIILVDGGSASASEILAGALSEQGVAKLVGDTTFGKGSVQELIDITDETALKVTVARWLTPNGKSISDTGIKPDYIVKLTKDDILKNRDSQMDKAMELISK